MSCKQCHNGSAKYRPSVRADGLKPAPNSVCAKRPSVFSQLNTDGTLCPAHFTKQATINSGGDNDDDDTNHYTITTATTTTTTVTTATTTAKTTATTTARMYFKDAVSATATATAAAAAAARTNHERRAMTSGRRAATTTNETYGCRQRSQRRPPHPHRKCTVGPTADRSHQQKQQPEQQRHRQ
jgi:hypothetical protein